MSIRVLELNDAYQLRVRYGLPIQINPVQRTEADRNISQAALKTFSNNLLEFVVRELDLYLTPFLNFQGMVILSRVSEEMPSALSLVKAAHLSKPARLFTTSSKELLFLAKNGGLHLFLECLESYFKNIKTQELKETILISRYNEAIRKGNFAIAYGLHIFAERSGLTLAVPKKNLEETRATKKKYEFDLRHFSALARCKKTAALVDDRCVALSQALRDGDIQKAEKEFAFVKIIQQAQPGFPPWEQSWKWVFNAIRGLVYERPSKLERAIAFVIDHSIKEVNPIQAILTGWTRTVSRGSLYVDQPKWVLDFLREKQFLTEKEIGEAIMDTIIYWLNNGASWHDTDQIAQKVFSFAKKQNIDLSQLGELIGRNMWSLRHYSTCTAFVQKNQLQIPRYWQHAVIQLTPGLKYFFNPAQNPMFRYTD